MRKLVLLNENGALTEVDPKALRREALALKAYIEAAPSQEELIYNYKTKLLPFVTAALDGTLNIPCRDEPYSFREMMEGIVPDLVEGVREICSCFFNRIRGSASLSSASIKDLGAYDPKASEVVIDGQRYEWVDFED